MMRNATTQEFGRRLKRVRTHGVGLSVDVYQPDIHSLLGALGERQVRPGYLEIFRATPTALSAVRRHGEGLLTYHGEGLWLTQPDAIDDPVFAEDAREVASQLQILESQWLTHECATKHIAGYSFGTYLPPLYTESSASVVSANAWYVQDLLDRFCGLPSGASPLLLLEMPPLTYFVAGTLSIPAFFRLIAEQIPCGLVLDIGHLWTLYRYSGARRRSSLAEFVDAFLDEFPLDRVVEIHVAGLAIHESALTVPHGHTPVPDVLPAWIDAHAAPIPPVLFEMLDQVLRRPSLTSLRGLALEVDTKPVELIVEEFERFAQRYAGVFTESTTDKAPDIQVPGYTTAPLQSDVRRAVAADYERYALVVAGKADPVGPEWTGSHACVDELDTYRSGYLPHEILHWGGDLEAMFPESCRRLEKRAVPLADFVSFWFDVPRPAGRSYDFFLLKVERFTDFMRHVAPDLERVVRREAEELRHAYRQANEPAVGHASEHR